MKKCIYILAVALSACIFFCACSNKDKEIEALQAEIQQLKEATPVPTPISTPEPSAYDLLNESEKELFDYLADAVIDFFNPSSVRVLKVAARTEVAAGLSDSFPDGEDCYIIQITGTNKIGGTINKYFQVNMMDYVYIDGDGNRIPMEKGSMLDVSLIYDILGINTESSVIDVGRINKALKERWENLGLD